eukprot:TRINITY_DN10493_c0_g2_i17.p1 TRINITY_DN10493_c0_g2~~TRINITY_DN10493_c0_g2_i17.p1  ORF type:complete len:174 (+),score=11.28 TRINITY_DN10493_c0_g2_i17:115-636(+)
MVSRKVGKILLCIAGTIMIIRSIINIVGSVITTNDRKVKEGGHLLNEYVGDDKYKCGFMSIKNAPLNVGVKGAECVGGDFEMDRGWFKSVYDHCDERTRYEDPDGCGVSYLSGIIIFAVFAGGVLMIICIFQIAFADEKEMIFYTMFCLLAVNIISVVTVSYTHLTLPTTPYV